MAKSAELIKFQENLHQMDEANTFGYMLSKYKLQSFRSAMIAINRTSNSELRKMKVSDLKAREHWGVVGFIYNGKPSGFVYDPEGYPAAWYLLIDGKRQNAYGFKLYTSWKSVREKLLEMLGPNGEIEVLDRGEERIQDIRSGNPQSPKNAANSREKQEYDKVASIANAIFDSIKERMKLGMSIKDAWNTTREDTKPYSSVYSALFDSSLESNVISMITSNREYSAIGHLQKALAGKVSEGDFRRLENQNISINPDLLKRLKNFKADTAEANAKRIYNDIFNKLKDFLDVDNYQKKIAKMGSGDYISEIFKLDASKFNSIADLARFYAILTKEYPNTKVSVRHTGINTSENSKGIQFTMRNLPDHFYIFFDQKGNFLGSELE